MRLKAKNPLRRGFDILCNNALTKMMIKIVVSWVYVQAVVNVLCLASCLHAPLKLTDAFIKSGQGENHRQILMLLLHFVLHICSPEKKKRFAIRTTCFKNVKLQELRVFFKTWYQLYPKELSVWYTAKELLCFLKHCLQKPPMQMSIWLVTQSSLAL